MMLVLVFLLFFLSLRTILSFNVSNVILLILCSVFLIYKNRKKGAIISLILITFSFTYKLGIESILDKNLVKEEYKGMVVSSSENYFIFLSNGIKYYVKDKDNNKEQYDYLIVYGDVSEIEENRIESEFNFHDYLENKGVNYELSIDGENTLFKNPIKLKKARNRFLSYFDDNSKALLQSILFNIKDYNNELINDAEQINLLYLFSVSGIFINLLFSILEYFLFLKFSKFKSKLFSFLILLPYLFFASAKISIIRIILMKTFYFINEKQLKNRFAYLDMLSIIGILMLFINPFFSLQSSFYLGFLISIILFLSRKALKNKSKFKEKISISLLIFALMIPIVTENSGQIHLFNVILQYIFIPFNVVLLTISIISLYTIPFPKLISFLCNFVYKILQLAAKLDVKIDCNFNSSLLTFSFYFLIICFLFFKEIKFKKFKNIALSGILFVFLISIFPYESFLEYSVNFINTGQGDCCVIRDKNKTYLIDTGGNLYDDRATNCIIPYLNKKKVYKIDAVFLSHFDYDHSGACDSLIKNFRVKTVYDYKDIYPIKIGNINFQNINTPNHNDENNDCAVLYFTFMNKKWLFTGDISKKVEKELIEKYPDLDCDVLKVAHHGSDTSTSDEFIKTISPSEAIISVGKNFYGHPSASTIEILEKNNVKVRRTDIEGTISYKKYSFRL